MAFLIRGSAKYFRRALLLMFAASMSCGAVSEIDGIPISGIYDESILLSNGSYEGPPFVPGGASRPRVELTEGIERLVDLDGDEANELVVVLTESSGGTGVFHYLAAFAAGEGGWTHRGTIGFGDRVQIRSLEAESGVIRLDLVIAGTDEPACCPSVKTRTRYFAPIEAATPYELEVGLVGLTSMTCPDPQMEVERRFLGALEGMTRFGFLGGQLMLGYRTGESSEEALVFEPADSAE